MTDTERENSKCQLGPPVIVLGMHRSGTSLLASLIAEAGVSVGQALLEPARDNPHGYFEDTAFVVFHNACLEARGFCYAEPPDDPIVWTKAERAKAQNLLSERGWVCGGESGAKTNSSGPPVFAFKDPRACLFAKEWLKLCPELRVIVIHRHPVAVVDSLQSRGEAIATISPAAGARLWKRHTRPVLSMLNSFAGTKAVVLEAEALFDAPQAVSEALALLGIQISPDKIEHIAIKKDYRRLAGGDALMAWCEAVAPGTSAVRRELLRLSGPLCAQSDISAVENARDGVTELAGRAIDAWMADPDSTGSRLLADTLARAAFMLLDPKLPDALVEFGSEAVNRRQYFAHQARLKAENSAAAGTMQLPAEIKQSAMGVKIKTEKFPAKAGVASEKDTVMIPIAEEGEASSSAAIEDRDASFFTPAEAAGYVKKRNAMSQLDNLSLSERSGEAEAIESVSAYLDTENRIDMGGADLAPPFDAYIARDPHPLPAPGDREGYYGQRHLDYWLSGLRDFTLIKDRLAERGLSLSADDPIFELGAASGRVSRHFWCQGGFQNLWCSDISAQHIEWIRRFLPEGIKIFQNTILPNLPMADNLLGFVFAFSVFTHIDEYELGWIAELNRVLRPGGIAYITVHTERTWKRLNPDIGLYNWMLGMKKNSLDIDFTEEIMAAPMPADRFAAGDNQVYGANVFHSISYIKKTWGRYFDVIDIIDGGAEYQDVAILRKP